MGGSISKASGTILTVVVIDIVITLIALLLTALFMPESLPAKQSAHIRKLYSKTIKKDLTAAGTQERIPWHSHVLRSLAFFKPNGRNTNLILLAVISSLSMLAYKGSQSVIILYTNQVFQWTEYEDGIMFSLSSIARLITILIIRPILVHYYQKAFYKKANRARSKVATEASSSGKQSASQTVDGHAQETLPSRPQHRSRYDDTDLPIPIVVDPYNPTSATSVQHLGEAALDLSSDESESFEEESFLARRQRQKSIDSSTTLTAAGRPRELNRSPRSFSSTTNASKNKDKVSEPSPATDSSGRTREETFSDMKFDTWMIRLGYAINSITYVGYGLASNTWMFYLATSLHAVCILAAPSLKALLTLLVEPSQFGTALGALQVVDSLATIFSPIVISWVYALTVKSMIEFVWYTCAAWTGLGFVLAFMIRQKEFRNNVIGV